MHAQHEIEYADNANYNLISIKSQLHCECMQENLRHTHTHGAQRTKLTEELNAEQSGVIASFCLRIPLSCDAKISTNVELDLENPI